jgi:8-oxo-dGTP diphosphatase
MAIRKGASAIIFNQKGEVLITQRHDLRIWIFPGGGIDGKETPEQTVKREVKEETGFIIKVKRLALVNLTDCRFYQGVNFVFLAEKIGGQEKPQKGEVLSLKWVDKKEIKKYLSKKHYGCFLAAVKDGDLRVRVDKEFPITFKKLPSFIWRRTLGKKFAF